MSVDSFIHVLGYFYLTVTDITHLFCEISYTSIETRQVLDSSIFSQRFSSMLFRYGRSFTRTAIAITLVGGLLIKVSRELCSSVCSDVV